MKKDFETGPFCYGPKVEDANVFSRYHEIGLVSESDWKFFNVKDPTSTEVQQKYGPTEMHVFKDGKRRRASIYRFYDLKVFEENRDFLYCVAHLNFNGRVGSASFNYWLLNKDVVDFSPDGWE